MNKDTKVTAITAALIVVGALVLLYFINETSTKIDEVTAANATLETEIAELQAKIDTIPGLQQELENLKQNLALYIRILPSPEIATPERLLELVQEKCERAQFVLKNFGFKPTSNKRGKGGFQEIELTLTAEGTYEQFLRFLNGLERHESFVRVNSFSCNVAATSKKVEDKEIWPLTVTLNISTFRFDAGG